MSPLFIVVSKALGDWSRNSYNSFRIASVSFEHVVRVLPSARVPLRILYALSKAIAASSVSGSTAVGAVKASLVKTKGNNSQGLKVPRTIFENLVLLLQKLPRYKIPTVAAHTIWQLLLANISPNSRTHDTAQYKSRSCLWSHSGILNAPLANQSPQVGGRWIFAQTLTLPSHFGNIVMEFGDSIRV